MADIVKGKIGNALMSVAPDGIVATADAIYDETKGKSQEKINEDTKQSLAEQANNIGYYECGTAAATAAKEITGGSYKLPAAAPYGGTLKVKFTYKNSAANPTLSINRSPAKPLYYNGSIASSTNTWEDGDVLDLYYDGTNFNAKSFVEKFATGQKVKNVGIDAEPTAGSENLVKSGGVYPLIRTFNNYKTIYSIGSIIIDNDNNQFIFDSNVRGTDGVNIISFNAGQTVPFSFESAAIQVCIYHIADEEAGETENTFRFQDWGYMCGKNDYILFAVYIDTSTFKVISPIHSVIPIKFKNKVESIFDGRLLTPELAQNTGRYYIDYNTEKWVYASEATTNPTEAEYYFSVHKGDILKITSNLKRGYAYVLTPDNNFVDGLPVNVIKKSMSSSGVLAEEYILVPQDCYIYFYNAIYAAVNTRFPAEIRYTGNISNFLAQENVKQLYFIEKYDGIESKFFPQVNLGTWNYAATAKVYYFTLFAGDTIKITSRVDHDAAFDFLKLFNNQVSVGDVVERIEQYPSRIILNSNSSEEYTVNEDCILFIFNISIDPNNSYYPKSIEIKNRAYTGTPKPELKFIGSYPFLGEIPNFVKNTFNRSSLLALPAWGNYKSTTGVGLHQGMAIYGDYIVLFTYSDNVSPSATKIGLIRLSTQELLATIDIPYSTYSRPHGNMLSFSTVFNSQNSVVPLLYVSQWEQTSEHGCLVYDITLTESTYAANLVQAIIPNNMGGTKFGNGCTDWCVDAENNYLYSISYMSNKGTGGADIEDNTTNPTMICKFNIPTITSTVEKTLTTSDILESFSLESMPLRQSGCIADNKLILIRGAMGGSYPSSWSKMHFIDLLTKQITTQISLIPFGGEPEGVSIYNDKLVMGWRNDAKIYQFDFYG